MISLLSRTAGSPPCAPLLGTPRAIRMFAERGLRR